MITKREILRDMGEIIDVSIYIKCIEKAIIEAAKQGKHSVGYVINKKELYDSTYDFQAILSALEQSEFIVVIEPGDVAHTNLVKIDIHW